MADKTERQSSPKARRQRRVARRRQQIMAAAARVFAQKGYPSATTREIADEADIAEGTLYNYFYSKRQILLGIFGDAEALMQAILLEGDQLDSREAMVTMFERALGLSELHLDFTRILFAEAMVDDGVLQDFVWGLLEDAHRRLQAFVAERIAVGTFRTIDSSLCAQLALGMFFSLIAPVIRGVEPPPSPEQCRTSAETVVSILLDGLRARQGA
jgi:AcrR family transcriptional regulator